MRPHRLTAVFVALSGACILLGACSGQDDDDAGPPLQGEPATSASVAQSTSTTASASTLPSAVHCTTQYRPEASTVEGSESPILRVERDDDLIGAPVTHQFANMTIEATFQGDGPEGRVVALRVTTPEGTQLWQAAWYYLDGNGEELQVDFGTQGFTGLHYIDYEGSSLQVFCEGG